MLTQVPTKARKGVGSPGAAVIEGCELFDMSSEN